MQAFLDAIPLPALLIDAEARIAGVNEAAEPIVGRIMAGRHVATALRQPQLLDAIEAVLKDAEPRTARFVLNSSDRQDSFSVTVRPVRLDPGGGVLVVFQDVSSEENAVQMRRDFVANVSHELRTPLTALTGFIETLKTTARDDPSARARFLDIMEAEALRMNRLVGDLLSLSRVEDSARVRPRERVRLGELIRSVLHGLAQLSEGRNVDLATDLPAEDIEIPGDADQIRQVLTNLVENAIKYGGEGGTVTVHLKPAAYHAGLQRDAVELAVADTGPGIDSFHLPRLTERFYRVDSHRSRQMGGTGLGLAIVKHIVTRHRGRLKIDSVPGQGSVFRVFLPVS